MAYNNNNPHKQGSDRFYNKYKNASETPSGVKSKPPVEPAAAVYSQPATPPPQPQYIPPPAPVYADSGGVAVKEDGNTGKKVIAIILIILAIIGLVGGAIATTLALVDNDNFRVVITDDSRSILSLSQNAVFSEQHNRINLGGPELMGDASIAYFFTPEVREQIRNTSGSFNYIHGNNNFMASSFYLRNEQSAPISYRSSLLLTNVTRNLCEAVRVMIIRYQDGVEDMQVFGRLSNVLTYNGQRLPEHVVPRAYYTGDGAMPGFYFTREFNWSTNIQDAWLATPFYNNYYVFRNVNRSLNAGEVVRYTLVMWIEGYDPETTNALIGGTMRAEMRFS